MKRISLIIVLFSMLWSGCSHKVSDVKKGISMPLVGAFGKYTAVTDEELKIFQEATRDRQDLKGLVPKKVSRQVVAGTNLQFRCKSTQGGERDVRIFVPLPGRGAPQVTSPTE